MKEKNETIKKLKEKGIVSTSQRVAILELIKKKKIHLTAEEIYKIIKKKYPTISFATVYNILQKFVELDEIQQLSIKRDRACYDWEPFPHHHFFCNSCEKIYDIEIKCPIAQKGELDGHKVKEVQAYFYGICKYCQTKDKEVNEIIKN